ncbi:hydroxymethylbilane synthase [Sphingomonas sp. SE158]|uniref:Hydroxymethylbilane synthase n=2 Tax=Sphingomonas alba TaxID=2908208 RepID=A0ABT0RND9_9SPHN|nr:hydroxymethylbilane synthase [Sphingomonas alba]
MAAAALEVAHHWLGGRVETVVIKTSGDKVQDRPLADIGGKALWTKELDAALVKGETHASVHSMKDVETERPAALCLAAMLPRADVRDRLIGAESIEALKHGAKVGTSSPRRAAQLLRLRPDLEIVIFRGNLGTRLAKLEAGEVDATLLAAAGLERLGQGSIGVPIPIDVMLPAPGQGAIGIECRSDDHETLSQLGRVNDHQTSAAVRAERAFARALGGSCHSPVGAYAAIKANEVYLRVEILSEDGKDRIADEARFRVGDDTKAEALAKSMLANAPASIRRLFAAG